MLGNLFVDNIWLTLSVWVGVYVSDYFLTLWAARLYRSSPEEHVVIKGSFEITPYFQDDIDALRPLSTRFIRALVLSILGLCLVWIVSVRWIGLRQVFSALVGALIFLEAAAHIRHVRNIVFLRTLNNAQGLAGRIEYPRWLSLRLSSIELLGFAILFLVAFLLSDSYFFIGGVTSCLITGLKHMDWANKANANASACDSDGNAGTG